MKFAVLQGHAIARDVGQPVMALETRTLLGGSWVVISRVISRITISVASITHVRGLTTPRITTNY